MQQKIKCTNCKGTGIVPNPDGPKRWKTCPVCHGTGKKTIKTK